jgi:hypothetical protein
MKANIRALSEIQTHDLSVQAIAANCASDSVAIATCLFNNNDRIFVAFLLLES